MSDPVVVAWIFPEHVSGYFNRSLVDMVRHDAQGPGHLTHEDGGFISMSSGPRIAEARNQVVDNFAENFPKAEWLLFIDSDMTFPPYLLEGLLSVADPSEAPIVGGLCFAGGKGSNPYPTIYREVVDENKNVVGIDRVYDYPRDALVKCAATGGACVLIHRGVLAAMAKEYATLEDGRRNPYPWYAEGVIGQHGQPWGEDILFCLRAARLGVPIHVHTGMKLGHMKTHIVDEVYYDNRRAAMAEDAAPRPPGDVYGPPTTLPRENRAARRAQARQKRKVH